jgi:3'-phosphoadenosine 5'-phosphosulfate sulfotransferase (PAPS reductase)/FAD synthetase
LTTPPQAVSYGGGVQSTALLVLAAQQQIPFRVFLFANVGADSEHPATLAYVRDVASPYAERHGIKLVELHRTMLRGPNRGQQVTLYQHLTQPESRSVPIPVRMANGAPGNRSCTADYKIHVVGRWLREHGATAENPATVALGISVDEIERARPGIDPRSPYQNRIYPLLDLGLHRSDCRHVIADAGLPVPPKSSCWFCPFHDAEAWRRLKRETPDLFDRACQLEATLNERRAKLGRDAVWLTRSGRPLASSVDDQLQIPGLDGCDSGRCFT